MEYRINAISNSMISRICPIQNLPILLFLSGPREQSGGRKRQLQNTRVKPPLQHRNRAAFLQRAYSKVETESTK